MQGKSRSPPLSIAGKKFRRNHAWGAKWKGYIGLIWSDWICLIWKPRMSLKVDVWDINSSDSHHKVSATSLLQVRIWALPIGGKICMFDHRGRHRSHSGSTRTDWSRAEDGEGSGPFWGTVLVEALWTLECCHWQLWAFYSLAWLAASLVRFF